MAVSSSAMRMFPVAMTLIFPKTAIGRDRPRPRGAAGPDARECRKPARRRAEPGWKGPGSALPPALGPAPHIHGHEDPERCAAGRRFAFDGSTVITSNLGHQSKSQASSRRFCRNKRVKKMREQFRRNTGAVVAHAKLE